jgi:hypothetical protein
MSRSRIDIHAIIDAHQDASATDAMSYMIHFERVMENAVRTVAQTIRDKQNLQSLAGTFKEVMGQAIVMGASDLEDATVQALEAVASNDRRRALTQALAWTSIAEETRSSNMMFFQACLLFGRAPNGKDLPELDATGA